MERSLVHRREPPSDLTIKQNNSRIIISASEHCIRIADSEWEPVPKSRGLIFEGSAPVVKPGIYKWACILRVQHFRSS